jgi:hypothetical protein
VRRLRRRLRACAAAMVTAGGALVLAAPAAGDPPLTVPKRALDRALSCQPQVRNARTEPVLLIAGTGAVGTEFWTSGPNAQAALLRAGHASCYLNLPDFATGDLQTAAEYVVNGIRAMKRRAGRAIGVYGWSQGGLLPRWALTFWPSLRRHVADVVAVAAPHHGTTGGQLGSAFVDAACRPTPGCPPAAWQQVVNSHLLKALNARADETPGGDTAWTTVRTLTDELVQPQLGPYPTSSLFGARNILIQRVCPGRTTTHFAAPFDSVSLAALIDAVEHRGGGRPSRFASDVCARPHGADLDPQTTEQAIDAALGLFVNRLLSGGRRVGAEPPVRRYARIPRE